MTQGSAARRAAQDDLADRQRPARQRRRLGLQELRARDAVLPVHLREPHRLPQRARARGRRRRLRLRHAARRGGRVRPQGDGRGEGLLHPARASCSPTSASGPRNDENLNETLERVFTNIEGSAVGTDSEDDLKGLFDDLDVNSSKLGPTVAKRNEKLVKLLDAIGDLHARQLRGQHDRRLRRRLRVPDADVRLQRRQVRRRVLHAAGGLRAARPDHRGRQDRGQQGLRPGLRLRLAAAEVRQGARARTTCARASSARRST